MIMSLMSFLLKLYVFSNIFQQSFYEYKNVFKYNFKHFFIIYLSSIFLIFIYIKYNFVFLILFFIVLFLQILYFALKFKIYLKFTKRIIRLWICCIGIFFLFINIYYLADLFCIIILYISSLVNKPFEYFNNKKFFNKSIKKYLKSAAIKIGVTGSYGKTSVKNYLVEIIKNKYLVDGSINSYNTPLGISKYINSINLEFLDYIVLEFGARRVGDINELGNLYPLDVAVVTEIGLMHVDTFGSLENIINEKMSIIKYLNPNGFCILNYENEYIRNYEISFPKYTYGFNYGEFTAKNIYLSIFFSEFDLYIKNVFIKRIKINMLGRQAILNVMPSVVMCYLLNISFEHLSEIKSVNNRLSLRQFADYYILDDAYNSNIVGVKYALEVLKSYDGMKFIITPGLVEMDKEKEELTSIYSNLIVESVDVCILVDNSFTRLMKEKIKAEVSVYLVSDFKAGFKLFLNMKKDKSILLIENDLPDSF